MHISRFTRLYHRLRGPNPLHPDVWEGRLRPITFRRYEPRDLDRCLEIYALNQPGRFPEGAESDYKSALEEQRTYFLVGEKNDQVVATGGMYYFNREGIAVFCYGLIHPGHQGVGIGTALVLTRLALLTPLLPSYQVMIFAVEKSFDYYRRFGFSYFPPWKLEEGGTEYPSGVLHIFWREILKCRKLLADHEIGYPQDENLVPVHEFPVQTAAENP